jgi:hypothetical protein
LFSPEHHTVSISFIPPRKNKKTKTKQTIRMGRYVKEQKSAEKRMTEIMLTDPISNDGPSRGEKNLPTASTSMGSPIGVPMPIRLWLSALTWPGNKNLL